MQPDRYSRIRRLQKVGDSGVKILRKSSVAIVGLGGTGSLAADLFCRAGISNLSLVDRDYVDESNMSRQILYDRSQIDGKKVDAAYDRLSALNPDVRIEKHYATLDAGNCAELLGGSDIVIDGTDNFTTRLIINDFSVKSGVPWIFMSALETYGQVKAILPGKSACLACFQDLNNIPYPTCAEVGVLPSVPSIISGLGFSLAVRVLLGSETGEFLYHLEVWPPEFTPIRILRNESCRSCGQRDFKYLGKEYNNLQDKPLY